MSSGRTSKRPPSATTTHSKDHALWFCGRTYSRGGHCTDIHGWKKVLTITSYITGYITVKFNCSTYFLWLILLVKFNQLNNNIANNQQLYITQNNWLYNWLFNWLNLIKTSYLTEITGYFHNQLLLLYNQLIVNLTVK